NSFRRVEVVDTHTPLAQVAVTLSKVDHVLVRPANQLECTLPVDADLKSIKQEISLTSDTVEAPVTEGQSLGTLTLTYGDKTLGTVDLVAVNGVERSVFLYRLTQIREFFSKPIFKILGLLLVLVLVIIIVRLFLKHPHRRYKSRRGGSYRRNYTGRRRR
ncbi:MAG: D-alanyl-D-alanine carboxypeptidase, partial [Oscillospiraceae bacterium]|nr:D-alanyl-D-alanine carboxypeptidase [Oscillospiraceae bacterium]